VHKGIALVGIATTAAVVVGVAAKFATTHVDAQTPAARVTVPSSAPAAPAAPENPSPTNDGDGQHGVTGPGPQPGDDQVHVPSPGASPTGAQSAMPPPDDDGEDGDDGDEDGGNRGPGGGGHSGPG
jgi:hypothetical protein